ncbi:PREDICTED: uncharacterized protein LOC109483673 [Branchiostoma belcheri]|uniref:Uncharacterized protein LOC109483673 n=1 Tax=Branchiostoma belcheri TaxID=7741 RepID=A0A6P5AGA2_BRABE|nr:PREDICTED: uncharacterized protein LOC109483673 [Branchiostoma belcheri]
MAASPATQLLSITSAAVSALGKSSQSSHSGGSSGGARTNTGHPLQPTVIRHFEQRVERRPSPERQESGSSGGEDESNSTANKDQDQEGIVGREAERADSANSSSASEILIRSTVLDHNQSQVSKSMNTSLDTRASFGSSGSQRVRVPRGLLKEVKSPFDREEAGVTEHVPAPLPGNLPPEKENRTAESDVPSVLVLEEQEGQEVLTSYLKQRETRADRPSTFPTSTGNVRDRPRSPAGTSVQPPGSCSVAAASDVVIIQTVNVPHKGGSAAGNQQGVLLQQGAAVEGVDITASQDPTGDDVKVSRFQLTEKQKVLKSQLGKRQDRTAPVKKVVQPRVIKHLVPSGGDENKPPNRQESPGVDTASIAAATAAAVAATAPFFQAHTDLEAKISSINEKLSRLQESYQDKSSAAQQSDQQLRQQLQQLTDMRIKFLEQLQQQQLEWQVKATAVPGGMAGHQPPAETYQTRPAATEQVDSRPNPPSYDDWTHPKYVPVQVHHRPTHSAPPQPTPATHRLSSGFATTHATQTSPLDTPAPRKHPPVPIPKDNSLERADRMARLRRDIEEHNKGRSILNEILSSHDGLEASTIRPRSPSPPRSYHLPVEPAAGRLGSQHTSVNSQHNPTKVTFTSKIVPSTCGASSREAGESAHVSKQTMQTPISPRL